MNPTLAKILAILFVLAIIATIWTVAVGPYTTFWVFVIIGFALLYMGLGLLVFWVARWIWSLGYQPEEHPEGPL